MNRTSTGVSQRTKKPSKKPLFNTPARRYGFLGLLAILGLAILALINLEAALLILFLLGVIAGTLLTLVLGILTLAFLVAIGDCIKHWADTGHFKFKF